MIHQAFGRPAKAQYGALQQTWAYEIFFINTDDGRNQQAPGMHKTLNIME